MARIDATGTPRLHRSLELPIGRQTIDWSPQGDRVLCTIAIRGYRRNCCSTETARRFHSTLAMRPERD